MDRVAQSYSDEGDKIKAVYVDPDIYNDNVILMRYATNFIDGYELKNIEFLKYKGFSVIIVKSINERNFFDQNQDLIGVIWMLKWMLTQKRLVIS